MKWTHKKGSFQPIRIDLEKRILEYDPSRYMVRFEGTEKKPILLIYEKPILLIYALRGQP